MQRSSWMARGVVGVVSAAVLVAAPVQIAEAHAGWSRHQRHAQDRHDREEDGSHGGWRRSKVVIVLPLGARRLRWADGHYYYCRGAYYRRLPRKGYVEIPAPIGAVVPVLPRGHRTIVLNGVIYHEYDGVYYKGGPAGYTVAPIASSAGVAIADADEALTATTRQGTAVVNVPNRNGSFTPVTLQTANSGMYIGPQGEGYPNLPTAEQLQDFYGK